MNAPPATSLIIAWLAVKLDSHRAIARIVGARFALAQVFSTSQVRPSPTLSADHLSIFSNRPSLRKDSTTGVGLNRAPREKTARVKTVTTSLEGAMRQQQDRTTKTILIDLTITTIAMMPNDRGVHQRLEHPSATECLVTTPRLAPSSKIAAMGRERET